MTEHKTFIRKIRQGDKIRYAEVWNERQGKKVIQHHVLYLGSDPGNLPDPSSFDIEKIRFGYLTQLILSDTISADDVYLMLDGMGKPVKRKELKEIVIRYNIAEKKLAFVWCFGEKERAVRNLWSRINSPLHLQTANNLSSWGKNYPGKSHGLQKPSWRMYLDS